MLKKITNKTNIALMMNLIEKFLMKGMKKQDYQYNRINGCFADLKRKSDLLNVGISSAALFIQATTPSILNESAKTHTIICVNISR